MMMADKNLLAVALGVSEDDLKALPADALDMMKRGVVVRLHIGRWRGWTKLRAEDLGLPHTKEYDDWLQLGGKRLMNAKLMKRIEAVDLNARYHLEKFGFKTFWGWFVPATAWPHLKPVLEERRDAYFALRDELIANYDKNVSDVLDQYREVGRVAYRRANALPGDYDFDWRVSFEDEAVERFVRKIASRIPSSAILFASFSFDWDMFYVPLVTEFPDVSGSTQEELLAAQLRREVVERLNEEKKLLVEQFFSDYKASLAELVYDAVSTLAETTQDAGQVQPRSVRQIWELIERLRALNLSRDQDIDGFIAALSDIAQTPSRFRDMTDVMAKLRDVAAVTRAQLLAFGREPRKGSRTFGADYAEVSVANVRSSRKRLGLQNANGEGAQVVGAKTSRASRKL